MITCSHMTSANPGCQDCCFLSIIKSKKFNFTRKIVKYLELTCIPERSLYLKKPGVRFGQRNY